MVECPPFESPETNVCSGRGHCVDQWTCACPNGWTGRADFVYGAPTCAIHIQSVQGLYGVVGCMGVIAVVFSSIYLWRTLSPRWRRLKGRRQRCTSAILMGSCCWATGILCTPLGIYRAIWPEETIGTDSFATVAHAIALCTYGMQMGIYYYTVAALAWSRSKVAKRKEEKTLFRRLRISLVLHCCFVCSFSLPLCFLLLHDPKYFDILPRVKLFGFACVSMYLNLLYRSVFKKVSITIRSCVGEFANRGGLHKTLTQMDQLVATAAYSAGVIFVICSVFGGWRGLQVVGFAYLNPILWIVLLILMIYGLITLLDAGHIKQSNSGSGHFRRLSSADKTHVQGMVQQTTVPFSGILIGTSTSTIDVQHALDNFID